jgi:hypothetical protein
VDRDGTTIAAVVAVVPDGIVERAMTTVAGGVHPLLTHVDGPAVLGAGAPAPSNTPHNERGVMSDKSPQKHNDKKSGKSLKDKRIAKKAKKADKGSIS